MAGLEPIIQKIQLRPISLPLVRPFTTAMHTVTAADAVQVDVLLTNGSWSWRRHPQRGGDR